MRPFTVQASISAPREEIFDLVADLSRRVAYCDHYMRDFRLARANPVGLGAAARFQIGSQWAQIEIVDHDPPRRIVERTRYGRLGRSSGTAVYDFVRETSELSRIELTASTEPATLVDRLREAFGARRRLERQAVTSLDRLRRIFEEPRDAPLARTTIAGYEPLKAARFGV